MKTNIMDRVIRFLLIFLIVGPPSFSFGCKQQPMGKIKLTGAKERLTMAVGALNLSTPVFIALEKGYFADEGLDVVIREHAFGKLAMEDMFSGNVDIATVADTPIVFNSFIRQDFIVLATFVSNYDDAKMVVRSDRGIKTAPDLKGKKVGTTLGTSAQFFLDTYLSYHGLLNSDIKVVNMTAKDLPAALENGKIDALCTFEPYAHQAMHILRGKAVRLPKTEIYRETFNLVTMKRFAEEHPESVAKVLRGIDRAVSYIRQNKSETIAMMSRKVNLETDTLEAVWDDNIFGLSLDQSLLITLEDQARWAIKNRLTDQKRVPNYLNFISLEYLASVKPEAVRMIK
jgi:NitT/TauT family transport system substrate-binding protein